MVNNWLLGGKNTHTHTPGFAAFAYFHGANISIMIDFKLPTLHQ
jgi:hypothetical protein